MSGPFRKKTFCMKRLRSFAVALCPALFLGLSACAPDSGFPPAMDLPDRFDAEGTSKETRPVSLVWWQGFRSSELNRLVEAARLNNLDVAVALARIDQADAQVTMAGSSLYPAINADGGGQRSMSSGARSKRSHSTLYSGLLSASYELDFWGKNRNNLLSAEHSAAAARFNYDVIELSTIAAVANTYLQLLAAQDRLRVNRENLANASSLLDVIRQRVEVGTGTSLDLAQQETVVAQQRAQLPPLQIELSQNRNALAVLVGEFPEKTSIKGGSLNSLGAPRPGAGMPSELMLRRPDIMQSEAQLSSSNAAVASARAALFPSIRLTGNAGYESPVLKTMFTPQSALYSLAANFSQPIFDGNNLRAQVTLAEGMREEDLQNYRKTVISAFSDVEQALVAVRETSRQYQLQGEATKSARNAYKIAEEQLRSGTIDITTVLNTQRTYFSAQELLISARLSQLQAIVSLHQALGGGWAASDITVAARMSGTGQRHGQ